MSEYSAKEDQEILELTEEYTRLLHAMQSGAAMEMNYNSKPTEPKHLRVGVNSSLASSSALGVCEGYSFYGVHRRQDHHDDAEQARDCCL